MFRRTTYGGLGVLCVLAIGAVMAQGAFAASGGTTGFTCKATTEGPGFSDAHCLTAVASGAKFKHVAVAPNVVTEGIATNAKTGTETTSAVPAKFITKKSGVTIEISCKTATGTGTGQNLAGPKMSVSGAANGEAKECTVVKPASCKVKEPIVGKGQAVTFDNGTGATEKGIKISPSEGTVYTTIVLENNGGVCALAGNYPIEGTAIGRPKGATTYFEAGEDELTFGKEPADIQGVATGSSRANSGEAFTPGGATTFVE
jgi:hypothetical protein